MRKAHSEKTMLAECNEPDHVITRLPLSRSPANIQEQDRMASNSKKGPDLKGASAQKPQASKKELSEKELGKVAGGFNPQPEPPGRR
jgi:hypothetical protein